MVSMRRFLGLIERIFGKDDESPNFINVIGELAKNLFPSGIN